MMEFGAVPLAVCLQRDRCALKQNIPLCLEFNIRRASVLWF